MSKWDKYESQLVDRMQEEAHEAWLEEKDLVLDRAKQLFEDFRQCYENQDALEHSLYEPWYTNSMYRIIKFIEGSKD